MIDWKTIFIRVCLSVCVRQHVGGCPVGLTCPGCWLCSCVNPVLCFCPLNWWGRKTGSWPSCALNAVGQEAVRSTQCCHCLQRHQRPLIDNKGKHPLICVITGIKLHIADITLLLLTETVLLSSPDKLCLFWNRRTHDMILFCCSPGILPHSAA